MKIKYLDNINAFSPKDSIHFYTGLSNGYIAGFEPKQELVHFYKGLGSSYQKNSSVFNNTIHLQ